MITLSPPTPLPLEASAFSGTEYTEFRSRTVSTAAIKCWKGIGIRSCAWEIGSLHVHDPSRPEQDSLHRRCYHDTV